MMNVFPKVISWNDTQTDATGWLVIDKLMNGICGGGTFMHPEATLLEVQELAHAMSNKNTLLRIPAGGAKAGIRYDHTRDDAPEVMKRFFSHMEPWLKECWCTGADLNTTNRVIHDIISQMGFTSTFDVMGEYLSHRLNIKNQSRDIFLRMNCPMGPYFTLSEGATGYSVAQTMKAVCDNSTSKVFIQGFGAVGKSLAYFLQKESVGQVVCIADVDGFIYDEHGLDIMDILDTYYQTPVENRRGIGQWLSVPLKKKYQFVKRGVGLDNENYFIAALEKVDFDILSPCAYRYSVTDTIVEHLAKRNKETYIIAGANNIFSSEKVRNKVIENDIKCLPEWVSNCGNTILYQELLAIEEIPVNYVTYFQNIIQDNILTFIKSCQLASAPSEHWYELAIEEAKQRISSGADGRDKVQGNGQTSHVHVGSSMPN